MIDILIRLRDSQYYPIFSGDLKFRKQCADEIERLRAELAELSETRVIHRQMVHDNAALTGERSESERT
jgi:hypothetical protein